ncbi:MAG TPA: hypothetical protein VHD60_01310 [Candidatus Saccharimonadales bacterium]|nr:hypothetical protein [Candidatus Saccharimonadales bacterium]
MSRRDFLRLGGKVVGVGAATHLLSSCRADSTRAAAEAPTSDQASPAYEPLPSVPLSPSPSPSESSIAAQTSSEIAARLRILSAQGVVHAIAPHPDDAISAWSLLEYSPHLIISLMTQGGESVHCIQNGGFRSDECKSKRISSWLQFFSEVGYEMGPPQTKSDHAVFAGYTQDSRRLTLILHNYSDEGLATEQVVTAVELAEKYSISTYGMTPLLTVDASYKYAYHNRKVANSPVLKRYADEYEQPPHPDHLAAGMALKYLLEDTTVGRLSVNGPAMPEYNTSLFVSNASQLLQWANGHGAYGWLANDGNSWHWSDLSQLTGLRQNGKQNFNVYDLPAAA